MSREIFGDQESLLRLTSLFMLREARSGAAPLRDEETEENAIASTYFVCVLVLCVQVRFKGRGSVIVSNLKTVAALYSLYEDSAVSFTSVRSYCRFTLLNGNRLSDAVKRKINE